MKNKKVALVDSGAGAWATAAKLGLKPENCVMWKSEFGFISYGNSDPYRLKNIVDQHTKFINNQNVDHIIIGCLTLSIHFRDYIKNNVSVPVYDLYSGLPKFSKDTVVMATELACRQFSQEYPLTVPCRELASLIEGGFDDKTIKAFLRGYLVNHTPGRPVLLGCSHYTLIQPLIEEVFKPLHIYNPVDYMVYESN